MSLPCKLLPLPSPLFLPSSLPRSQHSLRNYIHVNLCISLGISQLIFVAGADRTHPSGPPVHCQVIAVLLHYFFLVSFMWMLMEGVIIYVVLVRVFVVHTKRYMLTFTLTSYGLPLLYMGLLTLPLGFATPNSPYYGYQERQVNFSVYFHVSFIFPTNFRLYFLNLFYFIKMSYISSYPCLSF